MQNIGIDIRIKNLKIRQLERREKYANNQNQLIEQSNMDKEIELTKSLLYKEQKVQNLLYINYNISKSIHFRLGLMPRLNFEINQNYYEKKLIDYKY